MKLLDRYISARFLQFFIIAIVAFVLVFLVIDLVENIDHFIDKKAKGSDVALYYLYYFPYIIVLVMPIGTLLAGSFLGGYLVKNRELVAIRSSGISSNRLLLMLIAWGVVISIVAFLGGELLIPETNRLRDDVKRVKIDKRKASRGRIKNDLFYIADDGTFFYFRVFNSKRGTGRDIVLQRYDSGKLVMRIDAKKIKWTGSGWRLFNVVKRTFTGGFEQVDELSQMDLAISERPDDFARRAPKPEEMGFWQLRRFIARVQRSGIIPKREKTDMWMKIAYPLVNVIVLMLAVPLSLKMRKGSYIFGFGQSFFIAFLYLASLRAGQAFGYNGTLSPILAAFAGDVVFFIVGIALVWRMEKV